MESDRIGAICRALDFLVGREMEKMVGEYVEETSDEDYEFQEVIDIMEEAQEIIDGLRK